MMTNAKHKNKEGILMMFQRLISTFIFCCLICGCQIQQTKYPEKNENTHPSHQWVQQTPDLHGGSEYAHRIPQPLSLSDLRKKYKSNFILNGSPTKRQIALTFDDGPDMYYTPKVLDELKKENVRATFFLVGNRAEKFPQIVKRILQEGHEIGNHSYNHANFSKLNDPSFRDQITKTDDILQQQAGYRPVIFRPPYGNITENQILWMVSQGKKIVNWNIDSLDWKGLTAEQVATNVLADIQPGSIILQHSAGGVGEDLSGTVQALPKIIKKLKADGVQFVTVSELLDLHTPHS